jgi:hypothetical protein
MGESEKWLTELHADLAATDPQPMPTLRLMKHRSTTRARVKKAKKIVAGDSGSSASLRECGRIRDAARFLDIAPATLTNWITLKKFTKADGLRKMGDRATRIHMPTLKARFADGTLTVMGK